MFVEIALTSLVVIKFVEVVLKVIDTAYIIKDFEEDDVPELTEEMRCRLYS